MPSVKTSSIRKITALFALSSAGHPPNCGLQKWLESRCFFWMWAKALNSALAVRAAGDGRGAFHHTARGAIFCDFSFIRGQLLVVIQVAIFTRSEQWTLPV